MIRTSKTKLKKKPRKKEPLKDQRKKKKSEDDLFNQVIKLTGVPSSSIRKELKSILDRKGINANQLTLDQLRTVVASYLREIMGSLLQKASQNHSETKH